VPFTNPISNADLAELLQVVLGLVADNDHPSHAHLQLAGRLQAHLTETKEPLPAEARLSATTSQRSEPRVSRSAMAPASRWTERTEMDGAPHPLPAPMWSSVSWGEGERSVQNVRRDQHPDLARRRDLRCREPRHLAGRGAFIEYDMIGMDYWYAEQEV
jgi:hypothetical protein